MIVCGLPTTKARYIGPELARPLLMGTPFCAPCSSVCMHTAWSETVK